MLALAPLRPVPKSAPGHRSTAHGRARQQQPADCRRARCPAAVSARPIWRALPPPGHLSKGWQPRMPPTAARYSEPLAFSSSDSTLLSQPSHLQDARLIIRRCALGSEVIRARLLVLQPHRQIAAVGQVHHQLERGPEIGLLVVVHGMSFLDPIELTTAVVAIHRQDLPGVLVHIQRAAAVDVTRARLQSRVYDPDPMQLIAGEVLVDVALL